MTELEKARQLFLDGVGCMESREFSAAEHAFRAALRYAPGRVSVITNLTAALIKLNKHNEAKVLAIQSIEIDPGNAQGFINLGRCLSAEGEHKAAIKNYDRALAINPDYAEAWLNRGAALIEKMQYADALESCDLALAAKPNYADAWFNRGLAHSLVMCFDEAIEDFGKALHLNPDVDELYGNWLHAKMNLCDWGGLEQALQDINNRVALRKKVVSPFAYIGMTESPAALKACAEIYSADIPRPGAKYEGPLAKPGYKNGDRLKIAYFSADFHNHPTSHLMAELYELHDHSKFELFAFSLGPDIRDSVRHRVSAAFDHFIDVSDKTNSEVVDIARSAGIQIAIDLGGLTRLSRPRIYAGRVAPLQVNYLGFPGTMGMDCIDYVIADRALIKAEDVEHFTEKVVFLPHSYQANDSTKKIADDTPTRKALGLPETGFVFASFNNNYKITPQAFDIWMRLLKKIPDSVLWIFRTNETASINLRKEAESRGVSPDRLCFADRIPLPDHLARHRVADLFLDTFQCNAHTTASDALWAGLPIVTCAGATFASRVAASLLNAIGMPELITHTQDQYETLAFDLATKPEMMAAVREKLTRNRLTQPLFNTKMFARHIEKAYEMMWDRHQQDLVPDHIYVG